MNLAQIVGLAIILTVLIVTRRRAPVSAPLTVRDVDGNQWTLDPPAKPGLDGSVLHVTLTPRRPSGGPTQFQFLVQPGPEFAIFHYTDRVSPATPSAPVRTAHP